MLKSLDGLLKNFEKEIVLEEYLPIVEIGGSKVPNGWIMLEKNLVSNLNFAKESVYIYLKEMCDLHSIEERDLFVFHEYEDIKEVVKFHNPSLKISSKAYASFYNGTKYNKKPVSFFLHPFLYFLISNDSLSRSNLMKDNINVEKSSSKKYFHETNFKKLYVQELIKLIPFCLYKYQNGTYFIEQKFEEFYGPINPQHSCNTLSERLQRATNTSPSKISHNLKAFVLFLSKQLPSPKDRENFLQFLMKMNFFDDRKVSIVPKLESEPEYNYLLRLLAWTLRHTVSTTAYHSLQQMPEHSKMVSLARFQAFSTHFRNRVELFLEIETEKAGISGIFFAHEPVLITAILRNISLGIHWDFIKYMFDGKECKAIGMLFKTQTFAGVSTGLIADKNQFEHSTKNIDLLFLTVSNEANSVKIFSQYFQDEYFGYHFAKTVHPFISFGNMDYKAFLLLCSMMACIWHNCKRTCKSKEHGDHCDCGKTVKDIGDYFQQVFNKNPIAFAEKYGSMTEIERWRLIIELLHAW